MKENGLLPIIGESPTLRRVLDVARRFAASDLPILLVGPTGTGKDLLARHIHHWSGRRGALVDVNCGVIPRDLAEATLFGARRGAYTGSIEALTGLVEAADGGTLFLNEACSLSPDAQVKLLDALETGEYRVVGDHQKRRAEFRVVAAVQEGVGDKIAAGALRRDLYERLAGAVIELPPLAERRDDIVLLAAHFAAQRQQVLEPGATSALTEYAWPGNVRELRRVIERAGRLVENGTIPPAALVDAIAMGAKPIRTAAGGDQRPSAAEEMNHLRMVGLRQGWKPRDMAQAMGLGRSGLYARLKRLGVSLQELRQSTPFTGRPVDSVDTETVLRA